MEGIEALAGPHVHAIEQLTEQAMLGEVPLEEVYGRRLDLVSPTRHALEAMGRAYVESLVPDAGEVVSGLQGAGVEVRVLSGGLLPVVLKVAERLGVPASHVAAVDIRFATDGTYAGFDRTSPLARAGGKREVIEEWAPGLRKPVLLVGDGATDLEARPAVDSFLAYMGVADRPGIREKADAVIMCRSLAPVLPFVLADPPADPGLRKLYERGRELAPDLFPVA